MKKLLLATVLAGLVAQADNISITGLAGSHHGGDINYNSKHNYIGIKYDYFKKDSLTLGFELANFKNSYYNTTKIAMATAEVLPFNIGNLKLGLAVDMGYQEGYCIKGLEAVECKEGDNNKSLIAFPSIMVKWEKLLLGRDVFFKASMLGRETFVSRFGVEIYSW